jgi:hypothetical protein
VRDSGWAIPLAAWLLAGSAQAAATTPLDASEILRNADEVRNPQLDYTMRVTITSTKPGKTPRSGVYAVMVKGKDKTVIKTLSPASDRGRVLLMRDNDLWAFLPQVSKPLRISLRERLLGDVANGDLARANFSGDYTPMLARTERLDGQEHYVLQLSAHSDEVTYAKVVLWIQAVTFHPARAEFYAISGRLLKTCTYDRYQKVADRMRPTRLVMTDALNREQRSVLDYEQVTVAPLAEKYFTKDYLKKLGE